MVLPVPCGDRSSEGWPLQERFDGVPKLFPLQGCAEGPAEVCYL
jgi:hypothetical protein